MKAVCFVGTAVAKFEDAVYVLHAFHKKARKTPQTDIRLAAKRYEMIGE